MLSDEPGNNAAELAGIGEGVLGSEETTLATFCLGVTFFVGVGFFFFCCELILSDPREIHIKGYHLRSSETSARTFRYSPTKDGTQGTTLSPGGGGVEHALHPLVQTEQARRLIILVAQVIRVPRRLQVRGVVVILFKVLRPFLIQVRSLSKCLSQFSHCPGCPGPW